MILYCQWHVIKALFKCLSDYDVNKANREKCREIIRKLVYASSQDDFEKHKKQLFNSANDASYGAKHLLRIGKLVNPCGLLMSVTRQHTSVILQIIA